MSLLSSLAWAAGLFLVGRSRLAHRIVDLAARRLSTDPTDLNRGRRRLFLVALLAVYTVILAGSYRRGDYFSGDGGLYVLVARSLVAKHRLDQHGLIPGPYVNPFRFGGNLSETHANVAQGIRGEWYPKHPWFYPALVAPLYALLGPGAFFLANALCGFGLAAVAFGLAERVVRSPAAVLAAFMILLSEPFCFFLTEVGIDLPAAFAAAGAFLLGALAPKATTVGGGGAASGRRWLWTLAGLSGGIALLITVRQVVFLPPLALYCAARGRGRAFAWFLAGLLPCLLILGFANWRMFGNPIVTSYDRVMVLQGGVPALASHRDEFSLRGFGGGMRDCALETLALEPAAALAVLGWAYLVRRDRPLGAAIAGAVLAAGLFAAAYGHAAPSRMLLGAYALSVTPLACLLQPPERERAGPA